ncbi:MAG: DUF3732 domain-containing protein, partial [Gemmataceae bacterium]|nr:DUF3732 domain-containing protein [Gemmataceae bacterium]
HRGGHDPSHAPPAAALGPAHFGQALILDQPTQVYYPADRDAAGSLAVLDDADRGWVVRLFRWVHDRVAELKGQLQVIVTDHAVVGEPWFAEAVVERWRDGNALVPREWPRG